MKTLLYIVTLSLFFVSASANAEQDKSCGGQALAVFAHMGLMGQYASHEPTPLQGLTKLARMLYEVGVLPGPTLEALDAFVATEPGLGIGQCMADSGAVVVAEFTAEEDAACWGQASAVFAQTGEMGEHASQQPTPRLGLRNLARALADAGIITDDSMASLGAFVANELGLSIDACST